MISRSPEANVTEVLNLMTKPEIAVSIKLSRELAAEVERLAMSYDLTVGAVVREALSQLIEREKLNDSADHDSETNADIARPDSVLDLVRQTVTREVQNSRNWDELQEHLRKKNLEFVPKGGGLSLRSADTKKIICKGSAIGFGYSRLIRKFGCGFPDHSHAWLVGRVLREDEAAVSEVE
jgi:predicted transcriptional regulator